MKAYNLRCWVEKGWMPGMYRISWTLDGISPKTRKRYSRVTNKLTNKWGAKRFCTKWGLKFPEMKIEEMK